MSIKYPLDNEIGLGEELDELEDAEVAEMGTEEILAAKNLEKEELGFEDAELEDTPELAEEEDNERNEETV